MIGDMAVPVNSFDVSISFDQSFRHFSVPVAASNDDSTALTPSVKSRPPATSGVENGPFDHHGRVLVLRERRRVARAPDRLAALQLERGDDFVRLAPAEDEHAAVVHHGRRVPFADGLTPAERQLLGPRGRHGGRRDDPVARRPAPLRPLAVQRSRQGVTESDDELRDSLHVDLALPPDARAHCRLERARAEQEVDDVAFVRLEPVELNRRHGAEVQAIDVHRVDQLPPELGLRR